MSDWGGYGAIGVSLDEAKRRTKAVLELAWEEQVDVPLSLRPALADELRSLTGGTRFRAWIRWMNRNASVVDDFIYLREHSVRTAKSGEHPYRREYVPESARQWESERRGVRPTFYWDMHECIRGLRGDARKTALVTWLAAHPQAMI